MAGTSTLHPRGVMVPASDGCPGTIYTQEHFLHMTEGFWTRHPPPTAFIQRFIYNRPEPSMASAVTAQYSMVGQTIISLGSLYRGIEVESSS